MLNAAEIAGFHVLRLINEPTAAAVAYAFENNTKRSNVLIFDLGAGKLDVTVLTVHDGVVGVKATAGDPNIGGSDFDTCLVNHFKEVFKASNRTTLTDPRALRRLRNACEKAKKELSFCTTSYVEVEPLIHGIDFNEAVTRDQFEMLCDRLFCKLMDPVKQALKDAQLNVHQIDEILLVGGSTRIPKIQELLTTFFRGKVLNKSVNADEAVAYGAAIVAAKDFKDPTPDLKKIVLVDTIPYTIMMLSNGETCDVLKKFTPTAHGECRLIPQPIFNANTTISLFECLGENHSAAYVANCRIYWFHRVHKGANQAKLTFMADNSGIVQVTACQTILSPLQTTPTKNTPAVYQSASHHQRMGQMQRYPNPPPSPPSVPLEVIWAPLEVICSKGELSKKEIDKLKNEIESYKRDVEAQKARIQVKDSCERYAGNLKKFFENGAQYGIIVPEEAITRCDELLRRLDDLPTAEIVSKQRELEGICERVLKNLFRRIEKLETEVIAVKKKKEKVIAAQKELDEARLLYESFSKVARAPK